MSAAPDFAAPIEAWRAWRVIERRGELTLASAVRGAIWPPREPLVARCLQTPALRDWVRHRARHDAPAELCECGIYGATRERAEAYLAQSFPEAVTRVLGRVALWGTVVDCEHGYRASHAYPLQLYVDGARADEIAAGLARYGVTVRLGPQGL